MPFDFDQLIRDIDQIPDCSRYGRVTALWPALRFDGARAGWSRMPVPLGSDPAYWPRS